MAATKKLVKSSVRAAGAVVAVAGLALPWSASAQFGSSLVPSVTGAIVTQSITDAISASVGQALNARPVIDKKMVNEVTGVAVGSVPVEIKTEGVAKEKEQNVGDLGDRMVTGHADGSVGLWDMAAGRELARFKGAHQGRVNAVAVSDQAKIAVSIGEGGASQVWSLASGRRLARIEADGSAARAVVLTQNGQRAVTAYADGSFQVWQTADAKVVQRIEAFGSAISAATLRRSGQVVALGNADGELGAWEIETGKAIVKVRAHGGAMTAIAGLPQGDTVATVGEDGWMRVWNLALAKPEQSEIQVSNKPLRTIAADTARGQLAIAGDEGVVKLYDVAAMRLTKTFEGHQEPVSAVSFGKMDAVIHTASPDGTSRIFQVAEGRELVQIIASKNGWAALDSESGAFTAEGDAGHAVKWSADKVEVDMDQFAVSHDDPGLLSRAAVGSTAPKAKEKPVLSVKFGLPPIVQVATPKEDTKTDNDRFKLAIDMGDMGGGVAEVRLYQNGKMVKSLELAPQQEKKQSKNFAVKLINGKNEFRVVALSRDFIESKPAKVNVTFTGAKKTSTLHVVAIGINEYRNPALNLNYGVPDARGIENFYKKQPNSIFKETKFHTLFDRDASKANIVKMIAGLKDTNPQDVVVIYLAGHGETVDKQWYFLPTETAFPERPSHVQRKGISSDELNKLVGEVGAQKVVMFMDACKSGAALVAIRGFEERKALVRLSRASGVHVVAAAGKNQLAAEVKDLGHGAFTYVLLNGLRGKADRRGDGTVSIRELTAYLEDELPDLSEDRAGRAQFPVINSRGNDFPISVAENNG